MCLIVLAWEAHPAYRLVAAANRDEFYARPTAPAAWWHDAPNVFGGRDLSAGGTWLGVTRTGRFAAVTNVREPLSPRPGTWSRGHLVGNFLHSRAPAAGYVAGVAANRGNFAGFNLLCCDGESLVWYSNRADDGYVLDPGLYGVSNALLDTPWPKVVRAKEDLAAALAGPPEALESALFALLARRDPAPDGQLPDTGVGAERERALSSAFIATPDYGTRASTIVLFGRDGTVDFVERTIDFATGAWTEARERFAIEPDPVVEAARGGSS
ncbi:MAG TPA: NRDE family protein [Longimicrobium sp.]|nr:NRDE family protein [Longimicrobium sp.]